MNRRYEPIASTEAGRLPSEQVELELGIHECQLRWFAAAGELIPLPKELERQRVKQERLAKEQAEQRLEQKLF